MSEECAHTAAAGQPLFRAAISYLRGQHDDRVRELADRLNREGIDCEIDQYNDAPPQGWPQWMIETMRDRVILVLCTKQYMDELEHAQDAEGRKGVLFESKVLLQRIYEARGRNEGIVPIVFDSGDVQYIPLFLRDVTRYDLSAERGYDDLYRRLTGQPAHQKPSLGAVRILKPAETHEPPAISQMSRPPHFAMPRLTYGRYADALTFSNIGAFANPRHDTTGIEYFEPGDELKIAQFLRCLPGWNILGRHRQVHEGIIVSDGHECDPYTFGTSANGVHIRLDGSLALRSSVIGAHFLYDIERILATTYAICRFMHFNFGAYPIFDAGFGYVLLQDPYPHNISKDPYDGNFTMDARQPFADMATPPVMVWSRSAWPIGLASSEVREELARLWSSEFSTAARGLAGGSSES